MKIPDFSKIQSIDLKIKNLEIALHFYGYLLGFKEIGRKNHTIYFSANGQDPYIISLTEDKDAIPRPPDTTGLFHMAIRFPSRKELARVFLRLFKHNIKFQGFSDHLVSEAIYLEDPDENGIELYVDKPRETWEYRLGQVQMSTLPLDLNLLTKELDDKDVWNGIHPQTEMGHIHLSVSNLQKAEEAYGRIIGFNISNSTYQGALFFAADNYHHHVGTNIWKSRNGSAAPKNSVGMLGYTVKIPDVNYLKIIEEKAAESNLLLEPLSGNRLTILDFDKNKITLTL